MADPQNLPQFSDKRDILFGENTTDEEMRETGKAFMQAEQYYDALEFFARCEADNLARDIAQQAIDRGDTALYLRAKVVLEEEPDEDVLMDVAEHAKQNDRPSMARVAYHKAGAEEKAEELTERLLSGEDPEAAPDPADMSDDES